MQVEAPKFKEFQGKYYKLLGTFQTSTVAGLARKRFRRKLDLDGVRSVPITKSLYAVYGYKDW